MDILNSGSEAVVDKILPLTSLISFVAAAAEVIRPSILDSINVLATGE